MQSNVKMAEAMKSTTSVMTKMNKQMNPQVIASMIYVACISIQKFMDTRSFQTIFQFKCDILF